MGSVEFKNGAQLSLQDEEIIVAETSTLPYAARIVEPGKIHVFLKVRGGLYLAAGPSRNVYRFFGESRHNLNLITDTFMKMSGMASYFGRVLANR